MPTSRPGMRGRNGNHRNERRVAAARTARAVRKNPADDLALNEELQRLRQPRGRFAPPLNGAQDRAP